MLYIQCFQKYLLENLLICYWNSLVFYNSFLPEIAPPEDHDRISAKGFSLGYYGSVILLLICLAMIMGIDAKYTPVSFILVGVWWTSFSQLTYRVLPNNVYNRKPKLDYIKNWKPSRPKGGKTSENFHSNKSAASTHELGTQKKKRSEEDSAG